MKFLFENGRFQALLIALIIVSGFSSLTNLPRSEDPKITNRFAFVNTFLPGATASRVEAQITEKIELKLKSQKEVKNIIGISRPGISVITIELKDEITNSSPVWSRFRDLIIDAQSQLPKQASLPVLQDDRGYAYTKIIALTALDDDYSMMSLSRYAKELKNQLHNASGIEVVHLFGLAKEEVRVTLDIEKANIAGLTLNEIAQAIQGADPKLAAGSLINSSSHLAIELMGAFDSVERIKQIPVVSNRTAQQLTIADIARVDRVLISPKQDIAIVDGKLGIYLGVRMQSHLRVDKWSKAIDVQLTQFANNLPVTIKLHNLFDQQVYTQARLGELVDNIALGFILILSVLFLTLGFKAALIVGAALPLTVLFTLSCMSAYGLPIHQMSVTGLVVALGIMVDNAIVITDAIARYRQQGLSAYRAVNKAVKHFWLPLLSSTLTTILAFLPIVIMPGPAGEFVGGIALSVIFALIGSYIISHTLIAVFAGRFLPKSNQNGFFYNGINPKGISLTFKKVLAYSISKPKSTLLLTMCLPFLGFMSAGQLTEQFFPSADRDMFQVEVRLSVNNSLQSTESTVNKMSHYIKKYEGIEQVNWMVGSNMPIFYYNMIQRDKGAKNYAQAMVKVTDFERANTLIKQLQIDLDRAFPEAQTLVRKLEQGPPFNAPIELRIYGPNLDRLTSIGSKIRTRLISHPKVTHTRATLESGSAKVLLLANENKLSHAGVKLTDVAKQLNSQFEGVAVGSVLEETETVPVRLRVSPSKSSTIDSIQNTQFIGSEPLLLSAFSEAKIVPARNSIQRRNGQRVNIIEAFLVSDILPAQVLNDIELFIEQQQNALPPGYTIEVGGESQKRDEAVSRLLGKVGVIVVLLFSILVVSFNSFRITSIILMSALQSAFLGLLCVYIVGYPFGFTVIVALLGLMGLAINAAIVILSELQTSDLDTQYDDINKHIIASVMTCGRHISSTTITTVGGFLPLILAGGGFWPPFAVAIAGGTLLTTILSFFFVPAMYKVMRVHTN